MKKIYVMVGDPNNDKEHMSLSTLLASEYVRGAEESGHEIKYTHIADIKFDTILHKGYRAIQELEPDLVTIQEDMKWADHIVIFHPVWWASMPSLLQAVFERIWLPGFAFNFKKEGLLKGKAWLRHLDGKSAHIIQTSGTSPWWVRMMFGDPAHVLKKGILKFAGVKPVKVTKFGPVEKAPVEIVNKWREKVFLFGKNAK